MLARVSLVNHWLYSRAVSTGRSVLQHKVTSNSCLNSQIIYQVRSLHMLYCDRCGKKNFYPPKLMSLLNPYYLTESVSMQICLSLSDRIIHNRQAKSWITVAVIYSWPTDDPSKMPDMTCQHTQCGRCRLHLAAMTCYGTVITTRNSLFCAQWCLSTHNDCSIRQL